MGGRLFMRLGFLTCGMTLMTTSSLMGVSFDDKLLEALAKREQTDYLGARTILEPYASKEPKAKYYLGVLADSGVAGLREDQANPFYEEACVQLEKKPVTKLDYFVLGSCYEEGKGIAKDPNKAKQYRQIAIESLQSYAAKGNSWASYILGYYYSRDSVVELNKQKSLDFYTKACEQGSARACNEIGSIYENGDGTEKNIDKANTAYEKACMLGSGYGCANLGSSYFEGKGFSVNQTKAATIFQKGCELNSPYSCFKLGYIYDEGTGNKKSVEGFPINKAKAIALYDKACTLKQNNACYNIGWMYDYGDGVKENNRQAANYYIQALRHGYVLSADHRDTMMKFLYRNADEASLKQLVLLDKEGVDNFRDSNGNTPLMLACSEGQVELVKVLLERGADVNLRNKDGSTALSWAAQNGNIEIGKALLQKGANVNTKAKGITPLSIALNEEHDAFAKFLLENGADADVKLQDGTSTLMVVCMHGKDDDFGMIDLLLQKGVDINAKTMEGETPFSAALMLNKLKTAKYLLKRGAKARGSATALYNALSAGEIDIADAIVSNGGNVNGVHLLGNDPIIFRAVGGENLFIVKYLVEHGASLNVKNKRGTSVLAYASTEEIARYLVSKGAYPDAWTVFDSYSNNNNSKTFKYLMDKAGIGINHRFNITSEGQVYEGLTLLMSAAMSGHKAQVEELLKLGADKSLRDSNGRNVMDYARLCKMKRDKDSDMMEALFGKIDHCKTTIEYLQSQGL